MKKLLIILLILIVAAFAQNNKVNNKKTESKKETKTEVKDNKLLKTKASYAIGYDLAKNIRMQNLDLEVEKLINGFVAGLKNTQPEYSEEELNNALIEFQSQIMAKREAEKKEVGDKNLKIANDFLAANKTKEGVIATESGLQYKVLKSGNGPSPVDTNTVEVHYRGTFIDGKEFDSSYKRNQTAKFGVTQVIKGWTEALKLMKVGDKFELYIPPHIAYGDQGRPTIPANSLLIFEVELISIVE